MVKLTEHEGLSRETVRRRLAENDLKPWRKDMWCIPRIDGTYVARMEDVLDLYAEAPDPKHASWPNMVEIEIGVLRSQCLDRRIAERDHLVAEIAAWERQRNAGGARIKWMFSTDRARAKLTRAYPNPTKES